MLQTKDWQQWILKLEQSRIMRLLVLVLPLAVFVLHLLERLPLVASYGYGKMDSALFMQGLWLVGHFQRPMSLAFNGYLLDVFLGQHFMPIGFLYGLLYFTHENVILSVVLEALSYALAIGVLIYFFSALWHSRLWGLLLGGLYWAVFVPGSGHFYFESLAVPFVALAAYWTYQHRYWPAFVLWGFMALFKEYYALVCMVAGLILWIKFRRRSAFALSIGSLAYFLVAFFIVMPAAQPSIQFMTSFRYLGLSTPEIVRNAVLEPWRWFWPMMSAHNAQYMLDLLFPFALMGLLALEYIIPTLPALGLVFLLGVTGKIGQITDHYAVALLPLYATAGSVGARRLWQYLRKRRLSRWWPVQGIIILIMMVSMAEGIRVHAYSIKRAWMFYDISLQHTADVKIVSSLVPPAASVATTDQLMPYFSARNNLINLVNFTLQHPGYVVLDGYYDGCGETMLEMAMAGIVQTPTQSCYGNTNWFQYFETQGLLSDWQANGYRLSVVQGSLALLVDQASGNGR